MVGKLIVTVDTECDNQWRVEKRRVVTLKNIREIPRLQNLLDDFGVRPVYLVTYPVSRDPDCVSILGALLKDGRCEIGAHLHVWTTPPVSEHEIRSHAYLQNVAPEIQREKLRVLDASIAEHFGTKAVSSRGGRWSLDGHGLRLLEELGYRVDSSVTPGLHWRDGGPDFRRAGLLPYFPGYEDICRPGTSRILEVPVSIAFLPRGVEWLERVVLFTPPALHLEGVARRLRLLRRVWLQPSLATSAEMIELCDRLLAMGVPVLNLAFHSSDLMPGGSPYHATRSDVGRFFERLREVLSYLRGVRRLESVTFGDFWGIWAGQAEPCGAGARS